MGKVLAGWLALALLAANPATGTPFASHEYDLDRIASAMNFDGTNTSVEWVPCGQVNAYYYPAAHKVFLCNELRLMPASFIRFAFAHELAHGVIDQRDIPITGSEEVAADELASMVLIADGHKEDVHEVALLFFGMESIDIAWDPHPSNERRGVTLACYYFQSQDRLAPPCPVSWRRTVKTWNRLLGISKE